MSGDNTKRVLSYVEAFNALDMTRLRSMFASDARIYGVLGFGGVDDAEPIWRELHERLQVHLEPLAVIAEGDEVAVRFRETGKFVGPFRGFPGVQPTGRTYELVAMEWFVIADGLITARWGARDTDAMRRQVA